ncbi:rhodanese-like domain-containing protein [Aestuariirhabdus sp. LZHN29]|uniref:rhodanese-like domain-containing protein n=1 Tax=Aestuariirhabdus sp. LZHN29 TaxID=3417462 RepID=UPI003CF5242A
MIKVLRAGFWVAMLALLGMSAASRAAGPAPGELVIDVRTQGEYSGGHYPGAKNIPFDVIGARIEELTEDRSQPIALYCRSGRRASVALQTLNAMGYTNVTNYGGLSDISTP